MLQDLKTFDAAYKEGLAKKQAGRTADAVRALEQAAVANGEYRRRQGRPARARGEEGALGAALPARRCCGRQRRHAPDGGGEPARGGAGQSRERRGPVSWARKSDRAKEIYLRGYVAKDDDVESARKAFKLVIATLPACATAQKAKRWLDKLDGKVSKDE